LCITAANFSDQRTKEIGATGYRCCRRSDLSPRKYAAGIDSVRLSPAFGRPLLRGAIHGAAGIRRESANAKRSSTARNFLPQETPPTFYRHSLTPSLQVRLFACCWPRSSRPPVAPCSIRLVRQNRCRLLCVGLRLSFAKSVNEILFRHNSSMQPQSSRASPRQILGRSKRKTNNVGVDCAFAGIMPVKQNGRFRVLCGVILQGGSGDK
jgi:hypothetical protein